MGITARIVVDTTAIRKNRKNVRENVGGYMTREEAINILEEVKGMDDSMYTYDDSWVLDDTSNTVTVYMGGNNQ